MRQGKKRSVSQNKTFNNYEIDLAFKLLRENGVFSAWFLF